MNTLLRVDASMRTQGSISRAVSDTVVRAWSAAHPTGKIVRRDIGASPLPSDAWGLAFAAKYAQPEDWTPAQRDAMALVTTLADEILDADGLVLASPLYNFGVSQFTKVWIDLLIVDPRLAPGAAALQDKPAVLVVAQGGGYREGTPRHGWDHSTGYLERILRDNFGMQLETIVADLTLASSVPAMSHLVGVAEESLAAAHDEAHRHGTALASLPSAVSAA